MKLYTTFSLLRAAGACPEGYRKLRRHLGGVESYGRDLPISILQILDSNGVADALWSLRAVPPEQEARRDRFSRLIACDCAERVLPIYEKRYPDDKRPRLAVGTARLYALGQATRAELDAARDAAGDAARDAARAARAAAWDAARAARAAAWDAAWAAAWDAAWAAAGAAEQEWQVGHLLEKLAELEAE